MSINDLTIGDLKEIKSMLSGGTTESSHPFEIGKAYLIRTVTQIDIGVLESVGEKELVVSKASWIADTGRFHDTLKKGCDNLSEVEPYPDNLKVIIGRGAIIDACIWEHELPRTQK